MRLLSLRLCDHDSNISFFDGSKIHYYKSERDFNLKHHAFNNLWEWRGVIDKKWNIKNLNKDVDEIAIIIDPYNHNLPLDQYSFFPTQNYPYLNIENLIRINHHYAHALSLQLIHPEINNHIVIDGFGDLDESVSVIKNNDRLLTLHEKKNGSLGSLMGSVGKFLSVEANHSQDVAGKVMGLQSYGNLNKDFLKKLSIFGLENIHEVFKLDNFINFKKDLALADLNRLEWIKSVHETVGDLLVKFFEKYFKKDDYIGYTGGVSQNVIWNTKLKNKFHNLQLIPHTADDGLSLGGLKYLLDKHNQNYNFSKFPYCQNDEVPENTPSNKTIELAANAICNNKVVAWYQGNGELGYRALGNRSLFFNPFNSKAKEIVNKVKNREYYRPFGASVLMEDANKYFENVIDNPYMLFVSNVIEKKLFGITHVDNTCRYQTVNKTNKIFYQLLNNLKKLNNNSIVLNTSLNLAGKPILNRKEQLNDFVENKHVDVVIYGDQILKNV